MRSIETHKLAMTSAVLMRGRSPYRFMAAYAMKLFLSGDPRGVAEATDLGYPAGQVVGSPMDLAADDPADRDLRIDVDFDFGAVLADDSAERVYDSQGTEGFRDYEVEKKEVPLPPGPMKDLLRSTGFRTSRTTVRPATVTTAGGCSCRSSRLATPPPTSGRYEPSVLGTPGRRRISSSAAGRRPRC